MLAYQEQLLKMKFVSEDKIYLMSMHIVKVLYNITV